MNAPIANLAKKGRSGPWLWLATGCVMFGVLMALRVEVHSTWLRAVLAACAFGGFGFARLVFKKARATASAEDFERPAKK